MTRAQRSRLVGGVLLILLGAWFLLGQIVPGFRAWLPIEFGWPMIIVSVGVLLFFFGLLVGAPAMVVPACVVAGIGVLLYWQNATGNWASWSYAWALIPGFVGVGLILSGLLGEDTRRSLSGGAWLIVISLTLTLAFSALVGGPRLLGPYWPVLLILLGLIFLVRSFWRTR